jgi:hypothetical protein
VGRGHHLTGRKPKLKATSPPTRYAWIRNATVDKLSALVAHAVCTVTDGTFAVIVPSVGLALNEAAQEALTRSTKPSFAGVWRSKAKVPADYISIETLQAMINTRPVTPSVSRRTAGVSHRQPNATWRTVFGTDYGAHS